jgi:hypothetical protein
MLFMVIGYRFQYLPEAVMIPVGCKNAVGNIQNNLLREKVEIPTKNFNLVMSSKIY